MFANYDKVLLETDFFDDDAQTVARQLLGKVLRVKYQKQWLSASIIETEAYYLAEKASHASLGYTHKRRALFMPPGTIYMYYSRAGDSLNVSVRGEGNAVLVKAGMPYIDGLNAQQRQHMLATMHRLNPHRNPAKQRENMRLCSGQTLLCKSLGLKIPDWDTQQFHRDIFYLQDVGYQPDHILQTTRLGIPKGRDEHLPYRFIDECYIAYCTTGLNRRRK